jgi:hypothetical protein
MSEIIKNKYLDFGGLKKYDELIKALIASGHKELADSITALSEKIGTLEFEGSDDKSFAEVINEIYATLAEIDESLVKNDGDIAGVTSRVDALEQTVEDLGAIDGGEGIAGVVNKVNLNATAIETLNGEGEGSVKKIAADAAATSEQNAKDYADSLADNYDATGSAAAAETSAKEYADGLNDAMGERVSALEAIDHEKLVADAVAAVVADADSDFDTLKEVADWIASDKEGSAALQTTVSEHTESISTLTGELDALGTKVDGDIANLTTHMGEAATALAEVDGRLDALEAFEETHTSIEVADIEGLFAQA